MRDFKLRMGGIQGVTYLFGDALDMSLCPTDVQVRNAPSLAGTCSRDTFVVAMEANSLWMTSWERQSW